jgi:hypothetical protein
VGLSLERRINVATCTSSHNGVYYLPTSKNLGTFNRPLQRPSPLTVKKQGRLRNVIAGDRAAQPLASPAHMGNKNAEALIVTG